MKRPEIPRYIPPPLRSKFKSECQDKMEYAKESETENIQSYFIGKHGSSWRSSTDIAQKREIFDRSTSSNPRFTDDESCKDDDSSDYEDYCDFVPENNHKILKETTENNSKYHWKKEERPAKSDEDDDDKELASYFINAKISSNRISEEYTEYPGVKSNATQCLKSESKETKINKGLFYDYDDNSVSDIEAVIDAYTKKGKVLTSTPYSDIVDEDVLEAAKYVPTEESAMESTLLHQNDTAIDTNINDNSFEIYHDFPSVKKETTDYFDVISGAYIPPPVPAPRSAVHLPIITRLPLNILSSYQLYGPRPVSPQHISQWPIPQRPPQYVLAPSQRICSNVPYGMRKPSPYRGVTVTSYISPTSLRSPNLLRVPSAAPTPILPQERFNYLHSTRYAFNSQPLLRRSSNSPNMEVYQQNDPFFIPPPVPTAQLTNGSQQTYILNQRENGRSYVPLSNSFINRIVFDGQLQPQNQKKER